MASREAGKQVDKADIVGRAEEAGSNKSRQVERGRTVKSLESECEEFNNS